MSEFYRPKASGSRQVLVYLHGHGSSPAMLHPFFRQHHDDGWVRLCPQGPLPTDGGWSWFDSGPRGVDRAGLDRSTSQVRTLVDAAIDEIGADWSHVVLAGFSQGAATAMALAAELGAAPGPRLAGLLVQAGFVPEIPHAEVDVGAVRAGAVLVQHGATDEVVPTFVASDLGALIGSTATEGGTVEVQVLPGGHTLTSDMLDAARTWLSGLAVGG